MVWEKKKKDYGHGPKMPTCLYYQTALDIIVAKKPKEHKKTGKDSWCKRQSMHRTGTRPANSVLREGGERYFKVIYQLFILCLVLVEFAKTVNRSQHSCLLFPRLLYASSCTHFVFYWHSNHEWKSSIHPDTTSSSVLIISDVSSHLVWRTYVSLSDLTPS